MSFLGHLYFTVTIFITVTSSSTGRRLGRLGMK